MICKICSHYCDIKNQELGKCRIIKNNDGELENIYHGMCSILSADPIEKRPFFHFRPGKNYLSVGFLGCQFFCQACSNQSVSQNFNTDKSKHIQPINLIKKANTYNLDGVVFTYNEPTLYHEYIREVVHLSIASGNDLRFAIKTNGFSTAEVMRDLISYMDAFNVDIKGDDDEYKKLGGRLKPVLKNIESIFSSGRHLEISYAVLPGIINKNEVHKQASKFIANLSKDIPVHILYTFPFHKLESSYDRELIFGVYDEFKEKLNHVYLSNLFGEKYSKYRNTYCVSCGDIMVSREKEILRFKEECCGSKLHGIF